MSKVKTRAVGILIKDDEILLIHRTEKRKEYWVFPGGSKEEDEDQTYEPKWVNINKLPKLLLYPLKIRDWIINDYRTDFKDSPKSATLKSTELRQEI